MLVSFALILLAQELVWLAPGSAIGAWPDNIILHQTHFVDRFFAFDANWYAKIAQHGYAWDPAQPGREQSIAFYPLWILLTRLASTLAATLTTQRWLMVACAAASALASAVVFADLAREVLPTRAVKTAILFYVLFPGASFLLLAYPTGLINLLTLLALRASLRHRDWHAAAYAGLATAAAPLSIATSITIFAAATLARRPWRHPKTLPAVIALGTLSIAGLLGFIAFQTIRFHAPFAFLQAQTAWSYMPAFPQRLHKAALQLAIVPDFTDAAWYLRELFHPTEKFYWQLQANRSLNAASLGFALILAAIGCRILPWRLALHTALTLLLFIWFYNTSPYAYALFRLIYAAAGLFLTLALLTQQRPRAAAALLTASAFLLAGAAFMTAAGYIVI